VGSGRSQLMAHVHLLMRRSLISNLYPARLVLFLVLYFLFGHALCKLDSTLLSLVRPSALLKAGTIHHRAFTSLPTLSTSSFTLQSSTLCERVDTGQTKLHNAPLG